MISIIVTIISTLGGLFVAKITRDGYVIKARRKRGENKYNEYITKAQNEKLMQYLIDRLKHHYGASHIMLYYFHNGEKAANGYSFYKVSCLLESFNDKLRVSKKKDHQAIPLMLMADYLKHFKDVGVFKYVGKGNTNGHIENIEEYLNADNIDSTYSYVYKDLDGNTICNLVMNFCNGEVDVTDFDYFHQVGGNCASLMTNHFK